jgi:hypothetical protein
MNRFMVIAASMLLFGCGSNLTYSDLTARSNVPDGIWPNLQTTNGQVLMTWGGFSTSSIWVAYSYNLPDTIVAAWREGSIADHERKIFLRPLLPMIDPAKQKYHLQFWFHPGDSLDLKVDVLDIGDCRHTHGIGATRTPQHGPCGVMNDW